MTLWLENLTHHSLLRCRPWAYHDLFYLWQGHIWSHAVKLVDWLVGCLILNVPVNNFSFMLGRSHRFLGITSTFGE